MSSSSIVPEPSSTGIDPKVAGLLCYLGMFITGFFLVIEKKSRFVKFHAMQSIMVTVVLVVINIVLGFIPIIGWLVGFLLFSADICPLDCLNVTCFTGQMVQAADYWRLCRTAGQ